MWVPEAEDAEAPEQQERVPLGRVQRIVETVYGQRQDKEHNPHGEHAHDVWQVGGQSRGAPSWGPNRPGLGCCHLIRDVQVGPWAAMKQQCCSDTQ